MLQYMNHMCFVVVIVARDGANDIKLDKQKRNRKLVDKFKYLNYICRSGLERRTNFQNKITMRTIILHQ